MLVSRQLARLAHLAVGDSVVLAADPGRQRTARFRVAGIYEPTPDPMRFNVERLEVRLHLPDLIALTADAADPQSPESVTAVNLRLVDPSAADAVASRLSGRSIGLVARPLGRSRPGDLFAILDRFHLAIAAVTLAGSTAFLFALMVIRAEERRGTVGLLRLIGISRRSIVLEIILEGLVVAAAGALFGIVLAASAEYGINRFFQARYDTALVFVRVTPSIALRCLAIALPIGILTGAAASWALVRRPPSALVGR